MSRTEQLAAGLDTAAAQPLAEMLRERLTENEPILLDGSAVDQIGQACLQVLLGAQESAAARGIVLTISKPSDAMRNMVTLVGCSDLLAKED
jgi:chemotaxis protein CheX